MARAAFPSPEQPSSHVIVKWAVIHMAGGCRMLKDNISCIMLCGRLFSAHSCTGERSLQLYCSSVPIKCKLNVSQTCFLLNKQLNSVLPRLENFKCAVSLLESNFHLTSQCLLSVLWGLLSWAGSVSAAAGHFPKCIAEHLSCLPRAACFAVVSARAGLYELFLIFMSRRWSFRLTFASLWSSAVPGKWGFVGCEAFQLSLRAVAAPRFGEAWTVLPSHPSTPNSELRECLKTETWRYKCILQHILWLEARWIPPGLPGLCPDGTEPTSCFLLLLLVSIGQFVVPGRKMLTQSHYLISNPANEIPRMMWTARSWASSNLGLECFRDGDIQHPSCPLLSTCVKAAGGKLAFK